MSRLNRFAAPLAVLLALAAPAARAGTAGAVFDLLRPGTRTAVGLGGDPFRSPLLDECGWWGEPGFSREPRASVLNYAGQPLAPRVMPGDGEIVTGETSWRVFGAGRLAGRPLLVAGSLVRPRFHGTFESGDGALRVSSAGARADGALRVESLLPNVSAQLSGPLWNDRGVRGEGVSAGIRWRANPSLLAQLSGGRTRAPDMVRSDWFGEPIAASLNARSDRARFEVRLTPLPRLALEGSLARARHAPIAPRGTAIVYTIEPAGSSRTDQATLQFSPAAGVSTLARWTRTGFDLTSNLSWAGERFGRMNVARAEARSLLVAIQKLAPGGRRWLLDAERVNADAQAHVTVESWPFTPLLVDLLGLRWTGTAEGEARWTRLHAATEGGLGRAARARFGLAWYDLAPRGQTETWRPMLLVFGRTDDRLSRLETHRLQLAAVSLGFDRSIAGLDATFGLEQFVFAKPFDTKAAPAAVAPVPESGGAPAASGGGGRKGWPGGTQIEFALTRRF